MATAPSHDKAPDALSEGLIRIPDPDIPIYRIIPLQRLTDALRRRTLMLAQPDLWDDPFELVGKAIAVNTVKDGRHEQTIINQRLPPAFAQCWSRTAESDTLLHAYSRVIKDPHTKRNTTPDDEGVRVRSTPRKLFRALSSGLSGGPPGQLFFGAVRYLPFQALFQEIANAIGRFGLTVFELPSNRAMLLLLKRDAFSHEAELRAIFVQQESEPSPPLLQVQIDPASVLDDIMCDPRLTTFERKEREALLRDSGYTGGFSVSPMYHRPLLEVNLPHNHNVQDAPSAP